MSRPLRSGGTGGGGGGGGGSGPASKGRPKRRAAANHLFKYQLATNPSRAEENDLRRALQESLEDQHQQRAPAAAPTLLGKHQAAPKRTNQRLVSSTNSSDLSRSNNSSSSNESSVGRTGKPLKRNRQPALEEQPSSKRTKQTTTTTTTNGHSTPASKLLGEQPASRVITLPAANTSRASPVAGKATQTTAADSNRAIRTYSRTQPQLVKTGTQQQQQQFNVINDLFVVRSSTPKSSHPSLQHPGPTTTAILVAPFTPTTQQPTNARSKQQATPQPQPPATATHAIRVNCAKPTKNTNTSKPGNNSNHNTNRTTTSNSTQTHNTTTLAITAGPSNLNQHRKQATRVVQQVSLQSAKPGPQADLQNNESATGRASKVARCLIFNTIDLSFKPATFESHPHQQQPPPPPQQLQSDSKLNDTSGAGGPLGSWSLLGVPEEKVIYLKDDEPPKRLICYPAIKHVEGDVIQVKDSVLLRSGARKTDLPYIAKICSFWKNSETGGVMMSLLWYYRPEHTEEGRKPHNLPDEIFASRHRDVDSVECIEDKCYVLTFNEYCRYRKRCKMEQVNTTWSLADVTIPVSNESYPRRTRIPDCDVSSELVFCCRQIYDSRTKRLIKNPLISPKYGNI